MSASTDTALTGLKAICAYMGKCESTMRMFIREYDFPAVKIGGEWHSDTELIRLWRLEKIGSGAGKRREVMG